MKTLDNYLWASTLQGILIAWTALVVLDVFFAFIAEAGKTNALYSTAQAAIYLVYTLPGRFYELFPTATLIGTLLGLGNLSANSEFTAIRAAGISIRQIVFSILKLGALLVITIFVMGELLVPKADLQARNFKAHLKNKNIVLVGGAGIWIKEKNSIIHVGKVITREQLANISIYTFKDDHSALQSLTTTSDAKSSDGKWYLSNVATTTFEEMRVNKEDKGDITKTNFLNEQILDVATVNPNQLSLQSLQKIIKHQESNQLKSGRYELIYWKRFSVPLSAASHANTIDAFFIRSSRGGGAGQRVFIGIVVGIVFSLSNRAINELGITYGFSPFVSAFLPSLIFFAVGLFTLAESGNYDDTSVMKEKYDKIFLVEA